MISIGERMIPADLALEIVRTWLTTDFEGGRHIRRIEQIATLETPTPGSCDRDGRRPMPPAPA